MTDYDDQNEEIEETLRELIEEGIVEVKGVAESGELTYGLTEKGEARASKLNLSKPNFVVVIGNPSNGFNLFGPFDDCDLAAEWADSIDEDWWISDLQRPE